MIRPSGINSLSLKSTQMSADWHGGVASHEVRPATMRSLVQSAWLAATLSACATAVVSDVPEKDAGKTVDAAAFGSDASASSKDGGTSVVEDASAPGQDSGTQNVDSGNTNTSCTPFTGALATFDLTSAPGNQTSTPATNVASELTAGDLSRSSALTATAGTGSINASNWTTSTAADTTRYYTFKLTPQSGCALDLTSLSVTTSASKTGPTLASVATSDDNFGAPTAVSVGATDTPALAVSGATGAVEVRLYGYAASSTSGTLRIATTLTVSGSLK